MIEQLSGTRGLGINIEEGMEAYFDQQFTRKHGGNLNSIALGSSGDTVSLGLIHSSLRDFTRIFFFFV